MNDYPPPPCPYCGSDEEVDYSIEARAFMCRACRVRWEG